MYRVIYVGIKSRLVNEALKLGDKKKTSKEENRKQTEVHNNKFATA
jgi:hypothetical protein